MTKVQMMCSTCHQIKTLDNFQPHHRAKSGYMPHCKDCMRDKMLKGKKVTPAALVPSGKKECSSCREIKRIAEFNKSRSTKDGVQSYCRECQTEYRRPAIPSEAKVQSQHELGVSIKKPIKRQLLDALDAIENAIDEIDAFDRELTKMRELKKRLNEFI